MKDFGWGTALVALPLAHLFLASVYLYSYCFGFGGNIATFVSVEDVFSTSIRFVAPVYILIFAAFAVSGRREIGSWLSGNKQPEYFGPPRPLKLPKIFILLGSVMLVVSIIGSAVNYAVGLPLDIFTLIQSLLGLLVMGGGSFRLRDGWDVNAILAGLILTIIVMIIGLGTGQSARHDRFDDLKLSNAMCANRVVLRRFSSLYLTSDANGQHSLVDGDCKVRFSIPKIKPSAKPSDLPAPIRNLFLPS